MFLIGLIRFFLAIGCPGLILGLFPLCSKCHFFFLSLVFFLLPLLGRLCSSLFLLLPSPITAHIVCPPPGARMGKAGWNAELLAFISSPIGPIEFLILRAYPFPSLVPEGVLSLFPKSLDGFFLEKIPSLPVHLDPASASCCGWRDSGSLA